MNRLRRALLFLGLLAVPVVLRLSFSTMGAEEVFFDLLALSLYATFSGLVIFRRDGHPVGWLLLAVGVTVITTSATETLPRVPLVVWLGNFGWALVFALFSWICLIFPTGSLTRGDDGWSLLGRFLGIVGIPLFLSSVALASIFTGPATGLTDNSISELFYLVPWGLLIICFVGSTVSLLVRQRGAVGAERAQLRWVMLPLVLLGIVTAFTAAAIVFSISTGRGDPGDDIWAGVYVIFLTFPVFFGIAVLRYRLYDIDRILSRTVSYALLTGALAILYGAAVFLLSRAFPDQGDLAVAGSTLLAAGAFSPLRRRLQDAVDRRFNRARFDAERTLETLARKLSNQVDLGSIKEELKQVASGTVQPTHYGLWLK